MIKRLLLLCVSSISCRKGLYPPDTENIITVQPYHRCVFQQKAWFVFDKEIVALGVIFVQ